MGAVSHERGTPVPGNDVGGGTRLAGGQQCFIVPKVSLAQIRQGKIVDNLLSPGSPGHPGKNIAVAARWSADGARALGPALCTRHCGLRERQRQRLKEQKKQRYIYVERERESTCVHESINSFFRAGVHELVVEASTRLFKQVLYRTTTSSACTYSKC